MNIEEKFNEYKNVTEEIIHKICSYEDIQNLMDERSNILKSIFENNDVDRILINKFYKDLKIQEVDEKLKESIISEQLIVKEELKEIHLRKQANSTYNNQLGSINFLNKII